MGKNVLISVYVRCHDALHRLAAGIVGDDSADDVVHDVFCSLWSSVRVPDAETDVEKLGYNAVRNRAIDLWRRTSAHASVGLGDLEETVADNPTADDEPSRTYADIVAMSRQVLSEKAYEVFRLHDIEGLSFEQTAEQLGMKPETVRVALSRARKTLRNAFRNQ